MSERRELEDLAVDRVLAEKTREDPGLRGRLLRHGEGALRGGGREAELEAEASRVRSLLGRFWAMPGPESDVSDRVLRAIEERKGRRTPSTFRLAVHSSLLFACAGLLVAVGLGWLLPGTGGERGDARDPLAATTAIARGRASPADRVMPGEAGVRRLTDQVASYLAESVRGEFAVKANGTALVLEDVCLGVRALLASGSSRVAGPHAQTVTSALRWLEGRLSRLSGPLLASALATCVEAGNPPPSLASHAERLAHELIQTPEAFCAPWIPSRVLADAGVSLSLCTQLAGDDDLVARARSVLEKQLATRRAEGGDLAFETHAAILSAFPDLAQRDRSPHDSSSLFAFLMTSSRTGKPAPARHLACSLFPSEVHWASFNRRLRSYCMGRAPENLRDAAAMSLAVSVYWGMLARGERPV